MAKIHGGQVIARALKAEGTEALFTLTGGHILPILDGCVQEGIRVVDMRHEQAAAHAAEAYTRLTGRLGVAAVTAGPGVTDAMTAVATAHNSGTPMMLIGGRHMLRQELKGGLQEMDHPRLFDGITAWAGTAWQVDRLADYVATAARHAFTGRGAPVFLDIPMDVQFDEVDEDAVAPRPGTRASRRPGADPAALADMAELVAQARRPMIFAGAWSWGGTNRLAELAEMLGAPTYVNGKARGSLPHGHPLLGNHSRSKAMSECDLVLALGVDWDFRTSYGDKVANDAVVIHIDSDPAKIGWNLPARLGIVADPMIVVDQLVSSPDKRWVADKSWVEEVMDADRERQRQFDSEAENDDGPVNPQRFARDVSSFFGPNAVVAVDGGDIVSSTARWLQTSMPGRVLDPGPFGTLGTGAAYAIAAKVALPEVEVGIVFGDGAFGFNGMEYDTMVRLGIPIVGVVGNDGVWSNIKTVHRMFYPDRLVATDLGVRPYHEMVSALGGYGEEVEEPLDLLPALERARASGLPALINVHIAETMRMSSNYSQ